MENPMVRDAIENCRYCFMCRHAGTAFRATKRDALTARGRALQLSRVLEGHDDWTPESAEIMFEDPVDGLCRELCAFNWPEEQLLRESRNLINQAGLEPASVRGAVDAMLTPSEKDWQPDKQQTGSNSGTLFLSGWAARRYAHDIVESQLAVLNAGLGEVRMIEGEQATAAAALLDLGHASKARELSLQLFEVIEKINPERIVTGCSHTLRVLHGSTGGPDLSKSILVQHFSEAVDEFVEQGKIKLNKLDMKVPVGLHDAEHLARTRNLTMAPRSVARAALAQPLREFEHHGTHAESAGSGAALFLTHPKLTATIARTRLNQAREAGIETVITSCPHCYIALSPRVTEGQQVEDISQLVRRAAGL